MWESFPMSHYWPSRKYPRNSISICLARSHHWILLGIIDPRDKYFYANPARLLGPSVKSLRVKAKKHS